MRLPPSHQHIVLFLKGLMFYFPHHLHLNDARAPDKRIVDTRGRCVAFGDGLNCVAPGDTHWVVWGRPVSAGATPKRQFRWVCVGLSSCVEVVLSVVSQQSVSTEYTWGGGVRLKKRHPLLLFSSTAPSPREGWQLNKNRDNPNGPQTSPMHRACLSMSTSRMT